MNIQKINVINEKIFNSCYNNFETRNIDGKWYTIMPPIEFLPKHINLEYDKDKDKIILSMDEALHQQDMSINKIFIIKGKNNLINKIEYNDISKENQDKKRQEINDCIKIFIKETPGDILFYDLNLRLLELFKRVILRLTLKNSGNE
jgi:L-rhamnose mutarotase